MCRAQRQLPRRGAALLRPILAISKPLRCFFFGLSTAGPRLREALMKFIKYGKYVGEPADAVDLEELIKRLGDFFLQSGFESQFYGMNEMDPEKSMEALRQAILRALQEGDLLPEGAMSEELREMLQNADAMRSEEHTSELQSHSDLVCRLLLEKKKKQPTTRRVELTHV